MKPAPKEVVPVFSRPYLKKIPPDIAATQYLGFAPMDPWESSQYSSNPKYWVAATLRNRYGLEKMGMTGLGRCYKAKALPAGTVTGPTKEKICLVISPAPASGWGWLIKG